MKVNVVPVIVPLGIDLDGSFSSPERLAPANIPVTPENRTPNRMNTVTSLGGTRLFGSSFRGSCNIVLIGFHKNPFMSLKIYYKLFLFLLSWYLTEQSLFIV